ncbi:helix-turn-helix domain-containing protein [Nocardioides salsibiostraticola]
MTGSLLSHVVALVAAPVAAFELGVLAEVFGVERPGSDLPHHTFTVAALHSGLVPTTSGFSIEVEHGLERLGSADLVAVPSWDPNHVPEPELIEALRTASGRGTQLLSICSGAFLLGAAGLLDGRRAATHWKYAAELQRRHPETRVDADVLYVADGSVTTSAGTAAGIDACLHVIREFYGADTANRLARHMVVSPFREGGQAQLAEAPLSVQPDHHGLGQVMDHVLSRLDQPWPVTRLAQQALMSNRTFARRFQAATGTTPSRWVLDARLQAAERLLETTDLTLTAVASRTGIGSADTLSHQFRVRRGVGPGTYRQTFRGID